MRFSATGTDPAQTAGDVLVIPIFLKGEVPQLEPLLRVARDGGGPSRMRPVVAGAGFTAKAETTLPLHCPWAKAGWVLLVGMGPTAEVGLQGIRTAAAVAA